MYYVNKECIGGVIVSMLVSSVIDCGYEPHSGQTKDNKISICCLSGKTALLGPG